MNLSFVPVDDPSQKAEEILARAWEAAGGSLLAVAKAFSDNEPTGIEIRYLVGVYSLVDFVFLGTQGHSDSPSFDIEDLGEEAGKTIRPFLKEIVELMPIKNVEVAAIMTEEGDDVSFLVTLEPLLDENAMARMFAAAMAESLGLNLN